MKTNIFQLKIIPVADILPHEEYDVKRAYPLVESLKKENVLTNPIIVAPLEKNKYLQLDGMNRLESFKILKIPSILAQIVDYNDQEQVELSSWTHFFRTDRKAFFHCADGMGKVFIKEGTIENVGHRYIKEEGIGRLLTVLTKNGKVYLVSTSGKFIDKIKQLHKFVACYKDNIARDVLPPSPSFGTIEILFKEHPSSDMMIVFPTFTRHQIVSIVKMGGLIPSGITRHIIKRRCLNISMPLTIFSGKNSLDVKNRELDKILSSRPFRVYEEPTVYFE